jgi:hypothetical protein
LQSLPVCDNQMGFQFLKGSEMAFQTHGDSPWLPVLTDVPEAGMLIINLPFSWTCCLSSGDIAMLNVYLHM